LSCQDVRGRSGRRFPALLCSVATLLAFAGGVARAQTTIVGFNFTGHNNTTSPVTATTINPNLVQSVQISPVGPDLALQSHANSFFANGWPTAASPVPTQNYFTFSTTPNAGFMISLSSMSLNVSIDNQGPSQFVVRTSLDNFASNVATPFTPLVNNPSLYTFNFATYLQGIGQPGPFTSPIEFRMYGYAASNSNSHLWLESTTATPNAIDLTGSVTPVPEPTHGLGIVAAGAGLLGLCWQLRRRALAG
jgi:hypothetical protein